MKDYIDFVEEQIKRYQKCSRLVIDNEVPFTEINRLLAEYSEINLALIAEYNRKKYELYNRVAKHKGAIWYDLCDEQWRAIKITNKGYKIVKNPPILFRRYSHQSPQVEPIKRSRYKDI